MSWRERSNNWGAPGRVEDRWSFLVSKHFVNSSVQAWLRPSMVNSLPHSASHPNSRLSPRDAHIKAFFSQGLIQSSWNTPIPCLYRLFYPSLHTAGPNGAPLFWLVLSTTGPNGTPLFWFVPSTVRWAAGVFWATLGLLQLV